MNRKYIKKILPPVLGIIAFGGLLVYAYIRITSRITLLSEEVDRLGVELASTTVALSGKTDNLTKDISDVNKKAIGLLNTLSTAEQSIATVQTHVSGFEDTVNHISGTVNTLDKLSKTDPQLLEKYSKIFFLNEHYVPQQLISVDGAYLYSDKIDVQIHALVWPHLKQLLDDARKESITLYIKSGYRSFKDQMVIKSAYTVTYGAGTANQFSAEQGYSEHQLGTTVDFITTGLGGAFTGFEKTLVYPWLLANAYRYGFILSYYQGNSYYMFEPWHWRYVGVELAAYLHRENKHFYDLEQREIDTYLVKIFD